MLPRPIISFFLFQPTDWPTCGGQWETKPFYGGGLSTIDEPRILMLHHHQTTTLFKEHVQATCRLLSFREQSFSSKKLKKKVYFSWDHQVCLTYFRVALTIGWSLLSPEEVEVIFGILQLFHLTVKGDQSFMLLRSASIKLSVEIILAPTPSLQNKVSV